MSAVTVRRRDISVVEEREFERNFASVLPTPLYTAWTATLDGNLSTGESVNLSRTDVTFQAALAELEAEIAKNGWAIA